MDPPLYAILLDGGFVRAVLERRLERYPSADATLSRNPQTVAGIQ